MNAASDRIGRYLHTPESFMQEIRFCIQLCQNNHQIPDEDIFKYSDSIVRDLLVRNGVVIPNMKMDYDTCKNLITALKSINKILSQNCDEFLNNFMNSTKHAGFTNEGKAGLIQILLEWSGEYIWNMIGLLKQNLLKHDPNIYLQ
jgi:hypothetical protein